jgi:hypothetical protein
MPANTKADKKIIKRVVSRTITHQSALDEFESLASTPVNDLEKLIIEMQSILSRYGFGPAWTDENNPFSDRKSSYNYAALAVLHARSAIAAINEKDALKSVYNAMRAERFRVFADMRESGAEAELWAGRKQKISGALGKRDSDARKLMERKTSVAKARVAGVSDKDMAAHVAREEFKRKNGTKVFQTPKTAVDAVRKHLLKYELIKKERP